jgi:hypothetical protein
VAYDEALAARVRDLLAGDPSMTERKMFGGIAFMLGGNMAVGIGGHGGDLMVRVGAAGHEAALAQPHARPMDFTNKPMSGFVYVAPAGLESDEDLAAWVRRGADFARSLPVK